MRWYEGLLKCIEDNQVYCRASLIDRLKLLRPGLSENSYHWMIGVLIRDGKLIREGYDSYSLGTEKVKKKFIPSYSDSAAKLITLIGEQYPYVQFTVFETVFMNDFLNHLIAQNTIFLQVEKESSIYVFRFLQESGYQHVMYKPKKEDFKLYWFKECIVITDLLSEAPIDTNVPYRIKLEKMLVDMLADKLISTTFSKAEFPNIIEQAKNLYHLDKVKMLRYARRRNKEELFKKYLEGRR